MSAGTYDFEIEQGATFSRIFEIFDTYVDEGDPGNVVTNLTGWGARLKARKSTHSTATLLNLSMGSGLTIPTPTNGRIVMDLTSVQTAALNFDCAVYDLEIYVISSNPLIVDRIIQGKITLSREQTR